MFSHGISLVNDLTNKQHSSHGVGCDHLYMQSQMAGNLLLYAENLAMVEFFKNIYSMRLEVYKIKSVNSDFVTKAAVLLRNEIKNQRATQGWSLDVEWSCHSRIVVKFLPNYTDT